MIAIILFWLCVLLMFHSYVLFPWLLGKWARGKKDNAIIYSDTDTLPPVYILMSAYNEQQVIKAKLDSVFDTSYPLDKIHFYIGSDNSSDDTNAIIQSYTSLYAPIKFYPYYERNGKSGVLNKLYQTISAVGIEPNAIFILTDANVLFTKTCIYELVKNFKNEAIGQVAANVLNLGEKQDGISIQEKSYIQRENAIKYHEGKLWGAMQGAFGACYAMRADCFLPIPKGYLMEDFYISMHILQSGKKAICALYAVCYEDVSNDMNEEFKRKTRISTGNFQNLGTYWSMLFRFDSISFCFFSHKVIRWFGPFILLVAMLCAGWLAVHSMLYFLVFVGMVLLCFSPIFDTAFKAMGIHIPLLRFASYFLTMNLALLKGFYNYLTGVQSGTWNPTKRNV